MKLSYNDAQNATNITHKVKCTTLNVELRSLIPILRILTPQ